MIHKQMMIKDQRYEQKGQQRACFYYQEQFELMSRKTSFDLDRFYKELQRAESSLGKPDARRTINSPLVKEAIKEEKSKPLAAFKKDIKSKELTKTKINLDLPYEQYRHNPYPHINTNTSINPSHISNYRFSELSSESKEVDLYGNVRQRLQGWRKEGSVQPAQQREYQLSQANSKLQKSEVDESQDYQFLEKTMETPANEEVAEDRLGKGSERVTEHLLHELRLRNELFQCVQINCGQERSYYRRDDPSIRLQEHFRQHRLMANIIEELQRKYQTDDLRQLQVCLRKEGKRAAYESEGDLL